MNAETFPPVETESGEAVRQVGLRVLGERFDAVVGKSKRRQLTGTERADASSLGLALETLQAMAPVGQLMPARVPERLRLTA